MERQGEAATATQQLSRLMLGWRVYGLQIQRA